MKIGVVYPQIELDPDPAVIRDYAQAAESLGFSHVLAYDHILGANPDRPGGWSGPYTYQNPFMEPFVLFSYLAGITTQLEFVTGIIILPQRETSLVAKQAATLDVLCAGKQRLGVGIGWNKVEYIAQNKDFHNRGKRIEEQVQLLNRLWTEPLVEFDGRWHSIADAGINPLPVQRPIPIWFGGHADIVLRRMARLGQGWMPTYRTAQDAAPSLENLAQYLEENGRSMADFGLEARLHLRHGQADVLARGLEAWKNAGATHVSLNTMGAGLQTPEEHIQAIQSFASVVL